MKICFLVLGVGIMLLGPVLFELGLNYCTAVSGIGSSMFTSGLWLPSKGGGS